MRRIAAGRGDHATIYKLSSLALQYPDETLLGGRAELRAAAAALHRSAATEALERFFTWFADTPPLELARHYVQTFDLHKRCALYVTFYSLGDRRDRGLALLRLKKLYRAAGLPLDGSELPDYLPVMLEFAAHAPLEQGELVLREHRPALELVRAALDEQQSPYAHVLSAVCLLAGQLSPAERISLERLVAQGPPQELGGLEPFAPPEVMPTTGARR